MLEMINVSYAYKSKKEIVHVLDKVTYRFEIGEMYGIFGPSGSGKTTCLSLLAGLEKPDEGEILLDGENIQNIGGRKLRQNSISLVFQDYQLFDYMTSLENVIQLTNEIINRIIMFFKVKKALISIRTSKP